MNRIALLLLIITASALAQNNIKTVDLLQVYNLEINAAGPVVVMTDSVRNRIIAANTLSSSVSVIDALNGKVTNIPVGKRAFQHLKNESMTINRRTGEIALITKNALCIINPDRKNSETIETKAQFESVAFDELSGNVFVAGRESKELGIFDATSRKIRYEPWLETEEKLLNLNQTPPPPIRKVVFDNELGKIIAIDGYTSKFFVVDPKNGRIENSRNFAMTSGGRWHLAGYNSRTHYLYIVTEKKDRKVIEAGKIDIMGDKDIIIKLPEFTEGVGMIYNPKLDQVYIPYDNHASVHLVDFKKGGALTEIAIPTFGNDASALDINGDRLFIGSWAQGEVDVINVSAGKFVKRITNLGIIPHMFAMTYNPKTGKLYYPLGASAVNGAFGAAITLLDPQNGTKSKIYLGWSPIDFIEAPNRNSFLVFNNEDQFVEVKADGTINPYTLPYDFPIKVVNGPDESIYLSYGPHQSYWPVVYIWGAKNGILKIDTKNELSMQTKRVMMDAAQKKEFTYEDYYDRRIPRQAVNLATDKRGILYLTQNNWGKEPQFVSTLKDGVRLFEVGERIALEDSVERETTQRLITYDDNADRLYLARVAEDDQEPGILQIIDPNTKKQEARIVIGRNPSDIAFDDKNIYVANFESNTVSIINKQTRESHDFSTGEGPLKICRVNGKVYVIDHLANSLLELGEKNFVWELPYEGNPDNIFNWNGKLLISVHSPTELNLVIFDPKVNKFFDFFNYKYPFGETKFNTNNSAFYMNGQFGDAIYSLTKFKADSKGRLWVMDFLSGKLFIFDNKKG